jgi:nitrous oxide reductase accessory protein NosL
MKQGGILLAGKKILLAFLFIFNSLFAADSLVGKEYKDLNLKQEMCPVKNVSIEKHKDWLGYVELEDGTITAASSPKYAFTQYFKEQNAGKKVKAVYLTDYKTKKIIDSKTAFYVFGSNIMSVGGDDVIPFSVEADAKEYFGKHYGKKIFGYDRMTRNFIEYLEMR